MNRQLAAEKALHDQTNILPISQLLIVFTGLAISLLISFVDQNGISVTLPTIAKELDAENTISWAGTSSLIANTMFTVLYGRLSDIFGRKVVYLFTLVLLCIADLLCGLSRNAAMLYVARGLAGIAGGGVTSLTMIIVSDVVTLKDRGKYQGILGSALGLGNVVGPFIAAAFIMRSTWRGFFWLISPLSAISAVVGYFLIPTSSSTGTTGTGSNAGKDNGFWGNIRRIDYLGCLASSIGIIFLLIPISGGGAYFPWTSPMVISMLVIGGCAMVVFIFVEWKVATLPMLPVSLFKKKVIVTLFLQSLLLGAVYQSYLYYLPLYYQNARNWSPIVSAALTAPMVGCQCIFSILSGQYISRFKRYGEVIWVGFGVWTLGATLTTTLFTSTTHPAIIAIITSTIGIGVGLTFQPTIIAFQAHAPKSQRAIIISNRNFFRCMGGAVGLAVSAALLQGTLRAHLSGKYKYLADSTYAGPSKSHIIGGQGVEGEEDWEGVVGAYVKASRAVFLLQVPLIAVCFGLCGFVRDRGLEKPREAWEVESGEELGTAGIEEGGHGVVATSAHVETDGERRDSISVVHHSDPASRGKV